MALPQDYTTARNAFLVAAGRLGAVTDHFIHPGWGPTGEELAIDTAWLGEPDAASVLVVVSGTHGVEGFAGSACQTHLLGRMAADGALRGDDGGPAFLFVHAFNPFGFAWVRRVNEDNVDVNRNFVDFAEPPENAGYEAVHDLLVPPSWDDGSRERSAEGLVAYATEHGLGAAQEAITRGQYRHADGLYYGGSAPSWSARMMRAIWTGRLARADRVAVLDLHTGLGDAGAYELISHHYPDSIEYGHLVEWYGSERVVSDVGGESLSSPLQGEWLPAAAQWIRADVRSVTVEWGTVEPVQVLLALQADNWLHVHGEPRGPDAPAVKAALRAAFAPDDPSWLATVLEQFDDVTDRALAGLTSAP